MTVLGVGPVVALTYVAAVDDPGRFRRSKELGVHFGLVPRKCPSGEVDHSGRISKVGDTMTRAVLYEAANVMLTRAVRFGHAGRRLRLELGEAALVHWGRDGWRTVEDRPTEPPSALGLRVGELPTANLRPGDRIVLPTTARVPASGRGLITRSTWYDSGPAGRGKILEASGPARRQNHARSSPGRRRPCVSRSASGEESGCPCWWNFVAP